MKDYEMLIAQSAQWLGQHVTCPFSGVSGYVTTMAQRYSGNITAGVQPRSTSGESMPDAYDMDLNSLQLSNDVNFPPLHNMVQKVDPADLRIPVQSVVVDVVSDMKFTVTGTTVFINGCVYHRVETKKSKQTSEPTVLFMTQQRLKVLSKPIANESTKSTTVPNGGPSEKAQRAS